MNRPLPLAAAALLLAASVPSQDVLAVKGGQVVTVSGPTIDDGVVLIENGRITKVAKAADVEIPWTAKVIDATGKVVMPTWVVAHSQAGQRGFNENMQNVPWLSVADAIDPAAIWFEDALRNGIGTIHVLPGNQTLLGGAGMVVRPYGRTVEDMAVAGNTGVKLSLLATGGGRLQQIRRLRRAIEDVREYVADFDRRKAEFEQEQAAGAIAADKTWDEQIDRTKRNAVDLVQKKARGWLYVPSAAELDEALRLSQQLDLVLVLGRNIDEGVPLLTKLAQPVVLDAELEYFETDDETQKERKLCTAKLLADAGVPFVLSIGDGGPTAYPWWQLGTCVRNGVDRQKAIEALTTVPAKLLGLADQVGAIAEGKLGNLQILTGDPLQATTWVETVVLEGAVAYERSKDPRLKLLFVEPKPAEPKPAGGDKAAEPPAPAPTPAPAPASTGTPDGGTGDGKPQDGGR
ncbi:MAG: amidohydrolase family protein [Planctomycetes bacterium]|nr:amidohydrolase family protein [Planctomycetota bacterium]